MNELYHHGVKGMKWGVRRNKNKNKNTTQTEKLHLGIDRHGNINLIRGKTTKEAKNCFCNKFFFICWWYGFNCIHCYAS